MPKVCFFAYSRYFEIVKFITRDSLAGRGPLKLRPWNAIQIQRRLDDSLFVNRELFSKILRPYIFSWWPNIFCRPVYFRPKIVYVPLGTYILPRPCISRTVYKLGMLVTDWILTNDQHEKSRCHIDSVTNISLSPILIIYNMLLWTSWWKLFEFLEILQNDPDISMFSYKINSGKNFTHANFILYSAS